MSGLERLNALPPQEAEAALLTCCGSREWARRIAAMRPFPAELHLHDAGNKVWWSLDREAWLEAFRSHPRIGERKADAEQTAREQAWSRAEQSGMDAATREIREAIEELNQWYEQRFGYIYLVYAHGKTAEELLANLERRLLHSVEEEITVAAEEQAMIISLRLSRLLRVLE